MSVALRIFDDGAWVSVDDERRVGTSELWRVPGFCGCEVGDVVVEGFVDVGADGRTVEARAYGRCIQCGHSDTTDWLPVGRVVDGGFEHVTDLKRPAGGP